MSVPPPAPTNKLTKSEGAPEIAKLAEIEGDAEDRLRPDMSALQYAEVLMAEEEEDFGSEAMRMLGFSLDRREVIWWAIHCIKLVPELLEEAEPPMKEALQAAEDWFTDFSDNKRRIAFDKAEAAGMGDPCSFAAGAVFFCEGSIAPTTVTENVPADPKTVFALASTAVVIAAVLVEPEKARERRQKFRVLAEDVASGKHRWKEPVVAPKPVQATPTATKAAGATTSGPIKPPPPPKRGYY